MGDIVIRNSAKPKLLDVDRQTFLSTLDMRLYVNNVAPNPASGNGQFTECADSGYAPQSPTFGVPGLDGTQGIITAPSLSNTMTHDVGDYTLYGVYYTDPGDSDEWVYAFQGSPAIPIVAPGQVVVVVPAWRNDTL